MTNRVVSLVVILGVAMAASSASVALAQEQTGTIVGTVSASTGPAAGARVVLTDARRGATWSTVADNGGRFRFLFLDPGHYSIAADHPSLGAATIDDVLLGVGEELTSLLTLTPPGAQDPRPVESASLSLSQSARDVHITAEDVDRSFRSRDFTSLVLWAPGAFPDFRAGLWIDGAPQSEHRFHLDGVETTYLFAGSSGQPLPPEFAEDIQVKSSGYAAEYAGGTGAVVNVVTRTGTARFAGEAGAFFAGSALDAAPRPTLRLVPTDITRAEYVTYPEDDVRNWYPSYVLSGPVRSGRLWFFSSYMPLLQTTSRHATFNSTGTGGVFEQKIRRHSSSNNVTGQIVNRWRFKAAVNSSPTSINDRLPALDGSSNPASNFAVDQGQTNYSVALSSDYALMKNWTLSARGGVFTRDVHDEGVFQGTRYLFSGSNTVFPDVPPALQRVNGYTSVPTNVEITRDRERRTSLQLDTSAFLDWRGSHTVKAGVQIDRVGIDSLIGETGNSVVLRWNQALAGERGPYGYYEVNSNQTLLDRGQIERADAASNNVSFFVQDSWTLGARVTVDAGLRAENERIPSFSPDPAIPPTAIRFGFGDKLAPRIGAAWDPFGRATTKIYGSWGLFYDLTKLSLPVSSFGASQLTRYYYSLDTYDWPNLDVSGCPPACPGRLLRGPVAFLRPANDPAANTIDPAIKPMRQQEFVIGAERAIGHRSVAGLRFMWRHLDRALEDVGQPSAAGELLTIGNPGFGATSTYLPLGTTTRRELPKAVRDYTAVEATFVRRLANRWSFTGIYKWSRLTGNYSGLIDTDRGTIAPNRTQNFNHPIMMFDERGQALDGPLATDRAHVLKTIGTYETPFGTQVSLWTGIASGSPVLRFAYVLPPYNYAVNYLGRGTDGHLPVMPNAELYVVHGFKLGRGTELRVDLSVFNVFNLKTVLDRGRNVNQLGSAVVVDQATFFNGYDMERLMTEQRILRDPRFLMDSAFTSPRSAQIGVHLRF